MPLRNYSVLKGRVVETREERDDNTPHFQIKVKAADVLYRIAVNVMSAASPSELKYIAVHSLQNGITEELNAFCDGLHALSSAAGGAALDYIRGNLFDIADMKTIAHDVPGADNDLTDIIQMYMRRLMREPEARIYAFGETWGAENAPDKIFGFSPGRGIHDIHMNQGNSGRWSRDNGVYQDGGLIFHYPGDEEEWVGIFLSFQSQAIHTDDITGNPIEITDDDITVIEGLKIVAALVNPEDIDVGKETVTIMNVSNKPIDLEGWMIADKNKKKEVLTAQNVASGDCARITLSGRGAQLSNKGGQISLLAPDGLKAHGVSYSKSKAKKSGWSLVF